MPTEQTASPLELHQDLVCAACGATIAGEPLHYCGRVNGVETAHIHLCERCAAPLPRIVVQDGHVLPTFWPATITHRPPTEADGDEYGCVLVPGRCGWSFLPWRVVARDAYRWLPLPKVERATTAEATAEEEPHQDLVAIAAQQTIKTLHILLRRAMDELVRDPSSESSADIRAGVRLREDITGVLNALESGA